MKIMTTPIALKRIIRKASIADIEQIIFILQQNLIGNQEASVSKLEQRGFLINGFTAKEAREEILDTHHCIYLVSADPDSIIGYIVGCNTQKLSPDFQNQLALASCETGYAISSGKAIYLKHIAKKIGQRRVGKELLDAFLKQAYHQGYQYVICLIAEKPIQNKTSLAFHEHFGFVCTGYYQNAEKLYGVYCKPVVRDL